MGELPSLSQPDSLFGPHDVATTADGDMTIALGSLGSERELGRYGQVLHATEDGNRSTRADFLAYEQERDPDDPYVGSNPYSVVVSDVGELTGFPFPPGEARIWRVTPDGAAETHLDGFTNVVDVAFDSRGRLHVLEMLAGGLLAMDPEDPETMQGRLVRVEEGGSRTPLAHERLTFPTGLVIGPDDAIYVSNAAAARGAGEVVRLDLVE